MADEQLLEPLHRTLAQHSGYLRNTVREPGRTCAVCTNPIEPGWATCYWCNQHQKQLLRTDLGLPGLADRVGSMIYAIMGMQSYELMSGYKSSTPGPNQQQLVTILAVLGAHQHRGCASRLAGHPVTAWATVPSLKPGKIGTLHPLRHILTPFMTQLPEIGIAANPPIDGPRSLRPANFRLDPPAAVGGHVLVVDDSWVQGGHAQSVCALLKQAGAQQVSLLVLARVLDPHHDVQGPFCTNDLRSRAYVPSACPWTGAGCPPI
ncbi:hypothetical protein [Nocardia sp. IFM 10818]